MHTRRSFLQTSLAATSVLLADSLGAEKAADPYAFLAPEDAGFAAARALYNGCIATQPKWIARCGSEAGVQQAVRRAIHFGCVAMHPL